MSIETLKRDLQELESRAPVAAQTSVQGLCTYLGSDLLPFIHNVVDEVAEQDECIAALVDKTEDILHEESAEVLSGAVLGAEPLVAALESRLGHGKEDEALRKLISEWRDLAHEAKELIGEITIPDPDADPDPEAEEH